MYKLKQTFLFFCFIFVTQTILAQNNSSEKEYTLNGKVVDCNGTALPSITIVISSISDSTTKVQTITNENGEFSITANKGTYKLQLTAIGYTTLNTTVKLLDNVTLPDIQMATNENNLPTVSIIANKTTFDLEGYKTFISSDKLLSTLSIDEVLGFLPGMMQHDGYYTAYNHYVAAIYIDGKRIKQEANTINPLSVLEGKRVESIRVVSNAGVEAGNDLMGNAIIYITTHKIINGGYLTLGNNTIIGKYALRDGYQANYIWNYGKLSGNLNISNFHAGGKHSPTYTTNSFLSTNNKQETVQNYLLNLKNSPDLDLSLFYDFNQNNKLSFQITGHHISNHSNWNSTSTLYQQELSTDKYTENKTNLNSNNVSVNIDYEHSWEKGSLKYFAEFYHNYSHTHSNTEYYQQEEKYTSLLNNNSTMAQLLNLGIKGEQKLFQKQRLKYGVEFVNLFSKIRAENKTIDLSEHDDYNYSEKQYHLYFSYLNQLNNAISYSLGLRYEYTTIIPHSLSSNIKESNSYAEWLGQARLRYLWNKEKGHSVTFSYNRNIIRPNMQFLNPGKKWQNEYLYETGNPYLKPMVIRSFETSFNFFKEYTFTASYSNQKTNITVYKETENKNIFCKMPENGGTNESMYLGISLPIKLGNKIRLNSLASYSLDKKSYGKEHKFNNSYYMSTRVLFRLPWEVNLNTGFSYNSPSEGLYTKTSETYEASLSIGRTFLNERLRVNINTRFKNEPTSTIKTTELETWSKKDKYNSCNINISLTYNINWGKLNNWNTKSNLNNEKLRL